MRAAFFVGRTYNFQNTIFNDRLTTFLVIKEPESDLVIPGGAMRISSLIICLIGTNLLSAQDFTIVENSVPVASVPQDNLKEPQEATDSITSPIQAETQSLAAPPGDTQTVAQPAEPAPDVRTTKDQPKNPGVLNIAIEEFTGKGITEAEASLITDRLREKVLGDDLFRVMERDMMDAILAEQGFQQSGVCNSAECSVRIGQMLGVDFLVAGSIGKLGKKYMISAKVLDVATGQIRGSFSRECTCSIEDVLDQTTPQVALDIRRHFLKDRTASLRISSQPPGATIYHNGTEIGLTPVYIELLHPGRHSFKLALTNYANLDTAYTLEAGSETTPLLVMRHSELYLKEQEMMNKKQLMESQAKIEQERKVLEQKQKQRKMWGSIMLSAVGSLCMGGGYFLHDQMNQSLEKRDNSMSAYRAANSDDDIATYRIEAEQHNKDADSYRTFRNITLGFGIAAFAAVSFVVIF